MSNKLYVQYVDESEEWFDVSIQEDTKTYGAFEAYTRIRQAIELEHYEFGDAQTAHIYLRLDDRYGELFQSLAVYHKMSTALVTAILILMTLMFVGGVTIGQVI